MNRSGNKRYEAAMRRPPAGSVIYPFALVAKSACKPGSGVARPVVAKLEPRPAGRLRRFLRRCWLAACYMRQLHYSRHLAWIKAQR